MIREWERECNKCRKMKAKSAEQIMTPLPIFQSKELLHVFTRTTVDYGGLYITIQWRRKRWQKRYLWLCTCLATTAVILEVAYATETDKFLNVFYRMANRLGLPMEMVSNKGSKFIGTKTELEELVDVLKNKNKNNK